MASPPKTAVTMRPTRTPMTSISRPTTIAATAPAAYFADANMVTSSRVQLNSYMIGAYRNGKENDGALNANSRQKKPDASTRQLLAKFLEKDGLGQIHRWTLILDHQSTRSRDCGIGARLHMLGFHLQHMRSYAYEF